MWKIILEEVREVILLTSILAGLSLVSLSVAMAAVTVADSQTQDVVTLSATKKMNTWPVDD